MIFTITKSRLRMEIVRSFYSQTLTVSLMRLQLKNSTRMEVKTLKISSTQVIALKITFQHPNWLQQEGRGNDGEASGEVIEEFVGLRAKLHSYKSIEEKKRRRVKGIKKAVIKKNITHGDYGECLFSGNMQMRKINVIRSHKP